MSFLLAKPVQDLIDEFEKFPGIGPKSAARLAYFILNSNQERVIKLSEALLKVKREIKNCSICYNLTDKDICEICNDLRRDKSSICLVEDPLDIVAIENSSVFNGMYHVLGGVIAPLSGIGPEELRIVQLKERLRDLGSNLIELIIALNPTMEGEATAMYLLDYLKDFNNLKISRIARGLPTGADIEYADYMTLKKSIENRIKY